MSKLQRVLSRVLAAAASAACIFASPPSSGLTITVSSSATCTASVDGAGNVSINCSGGTTPSCSVSPKTQTVGSGGGQIATLTASNCGTGTWSSDRAGAPSGSGTTYVDTLPGTTTGATYHYTFSGSAGSDTATVSQSAPGAPPPPPPPTGEISCSSIAGITSTKTIPVPYAFFTTGNVSTSKYGGFNAGMAVVFTFTPPAGSTSNGQLGFFQISPTDSHAYNDRMMSISDTPCDFSGKLGIYSVKRGQEPNLYFSVGGYPKDKYGRPNTTNANLNAGQMYYVTVIQEDAVGGNNTCAYGTCNVDFALSPAPGT